MELIEKLEEDLERRGPTVDGALFEMWPCFIYLECFPKCLWNGTVVPELRTCWINPPLLPHWLLLHINQQLTHAVDQGDKHYMRLYHDASSRRVLHDRQSSSLCWTMSHVLANHRSGRWVRHKPLQSDSTKMRSKNMIININTEQCRNRVWENRNVGGWANRLLSSLILRPLRTAHIFH